VTKSADQKQRQADMQTALTTLREHPDITATQLANRLEWTANHARSVLYRLERAGKAWAHKSNPRFALYQWRAQA
jgi:predicted ArsR family transcriptional regulator